MTHFHHPALITGVLLVSLDHVARWVGDRGLWDPPLGVGHRMDNRGPQSPLFRVNRVGVAPLSR